MSRRILILYGTTYGQTAVISRRIANQLTALGYSVTLVNGADPDVPSPEGFDGVMIGASLIVGRHQKCVARYIRAHLEALSARPSAFFSVSASAAGSEERGQADAARSMESFLTQMSWSPVLRRTIAGALAYRRYGVFTRLMLRWISGREGGPTDTSRDHELTDWQQVERFVDDFTELPGLRNGRSGLYASDVSAGVSPYLHTRQAV